MSKQQLTAKYCPKCGTTLSQDRQGKVYCMNRNCSNFSVAINIAVNEKELKLHTNDTPLTLTNRQFNLLLGEMTKYQKTAYWEQLQATSHRQLIFLNEAITELSGIEKDLRNINLPQASREQILNRLNRIAANIERHASTAFVINMKATDVLIADQRLQTAMDRLQADNIAYQALNDKETKGA